MAKNTKNAFLALFWAYIGQPDNHIGWTTLHWCPLHQFIPLTQGPTLKFSRKNIENWRSWKTQFFESAILIFLLNPPMKISQSFLGNKNGSKFLWLPWFPAQNNSCVNICNTVYIIWQLQLIVDVLLIFNKKKYILKPKLTVLTLMLINLLFQTLQLDLTTLIV